MNIFSELPERKIFDFGIDETGRAYLLETARWTKFLAIFGFVVTGVLMIVAVYLGILTAGNNAPLKNDFSFTVGSIAGYMVVALLYLYPTIELWRFTAHVKIAMQSADVQRFNAALRCQRNLYRFIGVMVILLLLLYGIIIGYFLSTRF